MARLSRAAQQKKNREIKWLIIVVLVVVLLITGLTMLFRNRDKAPDRETLCPTTGALGHYIVLIDNTDPYRFVQKEALLQRMRSLATRGVPEGYMVSVFVLGSDFTAHAKPVFEKCNPGVGEDKSGMTANLARIKKRYQQEFVEPLIAVADSLLLKESSQRSPIFEMLQLVAINGFEHQQIQGERKLIVFSDMIPNVPQFSMYKAVPDFQTFKQTPYGQTTKAQLNNVDVELNFLLNRPEIQKRSQAGFWESYFINSGANVTRTDPMEG